MGRTSWLEQIFLRQVLSKYDSVVLSCSFGAPEGMILIDTISQISKNFTVCTIDTGRLPSATYRLIDIARNRYNFKLDTIYPKYDLLKEMVAKKGMNSFYESVENRKECCNIRKVIPFNDYLRENKIKAVITGLRKEQSPERNDIKLVELNKYIECAKINPIYDWLREDVMEYVKLHDVPITVYINLVMNR